MQQSQNLYSILNVSPDADSVVIEAAYKALMKKYHPDADPGGAHLRKAALINEAFTILKDPKRRADYNMRQLPPERVLIAPNPRDIAPPPRLKAVAWSGWVAAAAFGLALAVTINIRDNRVQPAAAQPQLAASEAEEAARKIEVAAANDAVGKMEAAADAEPLTFGASAAVAAPIVSTAAVAASLDQPRAAAPQPKRRAAKYVAKKKPVARTQRARARSGGAREGDFLEREGYIY
jgi:curved DNA-binding protein CbpA